MSFLTQVDIANRACQHCGVRRIGSLGFSENSEQAGEFGFNYDKLRRAELARNVWTFATRKTCIRPVTTGTMWISPTLWSSSRTYTFGSIVQDSSGYWWQSQIQQNLNNAPGNSSAWDSYTGPVTAQPFDTTGSTAYFAGEIVYETPGDGTFLAYMSLVNQNGQDPRDPSEWQEEVQYSKDQIVLYQAPYNAGTTYIAGAVVQYNDVDYISLSAGNVGHEPDVSPTYWQIVPATIAPLYWDETVAYTQYEWVTYSGTNYICLAAAGSTNQIPSSNPTVWLAQGSGTTYISLVDFNENNEPDTSPTQWSSTVPLGTANDQWVQLNIALSDPNFIYPLNSGPAYQDGSRNVFPLPANYLRMAPQDPKAGSTSFLGAPSGVAYTDWEIENGFIVSGTSFPIVLRFVADVTLVPKFTDMFCEGLALRMAYSSVERLTQATVKKTSIGADYTKFMTEARAVNGIETGPEEPPMDDWISCRI